MRSQLHVIAKHAQNGFFTKPLACWLIDQQDTYIYQTENRVKIEHHLVLSLTDFNYEGLTHISARAAYKFISPNEIEKRYPNLGNVVLPSWEDILRSYMKYANKRKTDFGLPCILDPKEIAILESMKNLSPIHAQVVDRILATETSQGYSPIANIWHAVPSGHNPLQYIKALGL